MKKQKHDKPSPQKKNGDIIDLAKRGRKAGKPVIVARVFGALGIICVLYCCGIAIAGFGTYFFLIWAVIGAACLGLCAMCSSRRCMEMIPTWLKRTFWVVFGLGMLLFCVVEGMIFTQYGAKPESGADYCIVLGAQWRTSGPSEVLRRRLDKAVEYLLENPDTKVIVSGGQGGNEPMAEAVGMKGYLIQAGIEEERILTEESSVNTYENLTFSGQYLDMEQDRVVVVTSNFHVFRALAIARKQGYANVEGMAASTVTGTEPNNLLREFLGVLKDFLTGNL